MNEHVANSLIANSGLHFKTIELDINPEEPLMLSSGRALKYTFLEAVDFLNDCRVRFDICTTKDSMYIPVNSLVKSSLVQEAPNGIAILDECGVVQVKKDAVLGIIEHYPAGTETLASINSLSSFRIKQGHEVKPAFELLLNKWLPMPMYELGVTGQSTNYPNGWCRVLINPIGEKKKNGTQRYRFVWAFDTQLANGIEEGILRPSFLGGSGNSKVFTLCNRTDSLLGNFLDIPDGQNDSPISDYLVSLLGIDLREDNPHKYKFLGYYIYLINFLRLSGAAPEVTLYNNTSKAIPVDMSIDVGNSRTCAVLFEQGDFKKSRMLRLRDLSEPWRSYENAFDMRLVFRRADFGGDITLSKDLFQWPSLVRVGEEAKHLIYRSLENNGESERTTNYSSPKRYLWDNQPFSNRWEYMVVNGDPTNLTQNPNIFKEGFTDYFADDGTYLGQPKEIDLFNLGQTSQCHYSRSSLITFVMIEVLNQAISYINSSKFRFIHGQVDCRRYLRNIIVTCPTSMPLQEQYVLRKAVKDAADLMVKTIQNLPVMTITPDPELLLPTDDIEKLEKRGWLYDEAFANQLVYLYAELTERYSGRIDHFFELKGHKRQAMEELGFDGKVLTIGTIDIGAGTTDVMITSYGRSGVGKLTPVPVFYDSFYTAGDDILHNIVRDVILEGPETGLPNQGSITSALSARINRMTPDELLEIPRIRDTKNYLDLVDSIRHAINEEERAELKNHLIHELMHHFFAENSANQTDKDKRCRVDFCTQVSHPMSQFFLEQLKLKRPAKLYSFDDIFPEEVPASYLLEHFEYHFGFSFKELNWYFDPEALSVIISDTMEPLMKALSVVMYAHHCDILVLSGRPTSLKPLTDLFLRFIPIDPARLVLLNKYHVGRWFPLATEEGYFKEKQKAVVAVGAEVGYLASTVGFRGLVIDFSILSKKMKSTARYMGYYDKDLLEVRDPFLTPENSTANLKGISVFPCFIGCKQFNSPKYPARPLYALYNNSHATQINAMIQRNYFEDRETVTLEDVTDMQGDSISNTVELRLQTLADDGCFWMDKGAFTLRIQEIK